MEVPAVVEADIARYHKWQSSDGNEIEAMYVDAKDSGVTLLMKNNPNKPYELGWERLSPESQALAEGIRRLKEELTPANPVIAPYAPAGEKRKAAILPRYTQGKWKNYNTKLKHLQFLTPKLQQHPRFNYKLRLKCKKFIIF